MLIKRLNVKPMIVAPLGSILPGNLTIPAITEGTFLEKIDANMQQDIAVTLLTTEELIALVEKPHLFGIDVIALVGVPGGRYDAVWSSYIAPLRRISLETLDSEVKKLRDKAENPEPRPRSIMDGLPPRPGYTPDDLSPPASDGSDDVIV